MPAWKSSEDSESKEFLMLLILSDNETLKNEPWFKSGFSRPAGQPSDEIITTAAT